MSVEPINTLEIIVQRKSGTSWPVVVEYSRAGVLLPSRSEGVLEVGEEGVQQLTSLLGQPRDYGIELGQALFRQNVRDAFVGALRESEDQLRVLLCIEANDLRSVRWERLGAPIDGGWGLLSQDQIDNPPAEEANASHDWRSGPQMVEMPVGSFQMGSPATDGDAEGNEKPQHAVTIAKPFAVSRYEITFAEWDACVADGGCNDYRPDDEGWGRSDSPVINLSWKEAQAYTHWLSGKTGKNYRLLTEAEWEFTACAGRSTRYGWGDDAGAGNSNCKTCGSQWDGHSTAPAGSFNPNTFGLFDMNGNVWEWVQNCWHPDYSGAPTDGSAWDVGPQCSERVLRGGSWDNSAAAIRSAQRSGGAPDARSNKVGFRVARDE